MDKMQMLAGLDREKNQIYNREKQIKNELPKAGGGKRENYLKLLKELEKERNLIINIEKELTVVEEGVIELVMPEEVKEEIEELKNHKMTTDDKVGIVKMKENEPARRFIVFPGDGKFCPICGLEKKTSSHHLIPKRLQCKNPFLRELKLKMCTDCHNEIHSEGKYIALFHIMQEVMEDLTKGSTAIDKYHGIINYIKEGKL